MKLQHLILCFCMLSSICTLQAQTTAQKIKSIVDHYGKEGLFNGSILVAQKGKIIFKK